METTQARGTVLEAPAPLSQTRAKSPARVLLVALFFGWLFDFLFYGKMLGISVPIFVLLLVAALFLLGRVEGVSPALRNAWLVVPLLFFACMVAVRANIFLSVLNVFTVLALLGLFAYYYANGHLDRLGIWGYPIVLLLTGINALGLAGPAVSSTMQSTRMGRRTGSGPVVPVLKGVLIAFPVLLVFAWLLASADTIFASYLGDVFRLDFLANFGEWIWRITIALVAAWLVAGGLIYALNRRPTPAESDGVEPATLPPGRLMGPTEVATVLVLVDLLFAAFVSIQFAYLFAGRTLSTLEDSSYKHYARQGFGELIAVAVLTILLILFFRWLARNDTPGQVRLFNVLGTAMVGLTTVILVSAWLRMLYWEEVADYIYTEKRLYVRVFIVWLALTFVWLLVCLWWRRANFAIGAFVAALGFLATLNVMNPDADVVQYDLERAKTTGYLYTPYLAGLSEDAVPAMVAAIDTAPPEARPDLRNDLAQRFDRMQADASWQGWQSFHLSRWEAYDLLLQNRAKLGR